MTTPTHFRVPMLTAPMVEQLFSPAGLPCCQYTLRARVAGHSGLVEIFLDGAPFRSGLKRYQAIRVAAFMREAAREGWR